MPSADSWLIFAIGSYWSWFARRCWIVERRKWQSAENATATQSAGANLPEEKRKERLRKKKENKPRFDLRAELFRMTGTDLTRIDGIDVRTAATVISEARWDMSKWRTGGSFRFLVASVSRQQS